MSGGHGDGCPGWIVTYCDMVTLLICFFIVLATFGSREKDKLKAALSSVIHGHGGDGFAGPPRKGGERNQVVVRQFPLMGQPRWRGSEAPPTYSDPDMDLRDAVHLGLENPPLGTMLDSYEVQLPRGTMFDGAGKLTESGEKLLGRIANQMEKLPYEIQVRAGSEELVTKAARVYRFLFDTGKVAHTRLGVALRSDGSAEDLRIHFLRIP